MLLTVETKRLLSLRSDHNGYILPSFWYQREKIITNWDTSGKSWYVLYSTAPAILDRHIIMCIPHFYCPRFLPLILQDLNMTLFFKDLKKVNPYEMQLFENSTFYFIQSPRNPPPPHTAKDVSCLLEQRQCWATNKELPTKYCVSCKLHSSFATQHL